MKTCLKVLSGDLEKIVYKVENRVRWDLNPFFLYPKKSKMK